MLELIKRYSDELQRAFPCVNADECAGQGARVRGLRLTGELLRNSEPGALVDKLMAQTPADMRVVTRDGCALTQLMPLWTAKALGMDFWLVVFCSDEWEIVPEGGSIPPLNQTL